MAKCRPGHFDPNWYLQTYKDVADAGMNPLKHYTRYGRGEGRLPCFMTAIWRERDLRWNFLEDGAGALEALAAHGPAPDRVWAALACARDAARRGDWGAAHGWLRPLDEQRDLIAGFCLPDHATLAIEAALMAGDLARAQVIWRAARRAFGALPDLQLAGANIHAALARSTGATNNQHGRSWRWSLARLYARARLSGVAVSDPDTGTGRLPAFDRLRPAWGGGAWGGGVRRAGPLVSIIMPARDAGATIETALQSLRNQSWGNIEILVIDNGSRDATADITRRLGASDPRIRLLTGPAEPGAYPARNIGLAAARGAFITVLDGDDWAHPARIARQVRALLRQPSRAASVSHWVRTTPDLRFTRWWGEAGLIHPNISSLMIRAELRDRLGYWDRARAGADSEYYHRIEAVCGARAIALVCPDVPLSFGRISPRSLTQSVQTNISSQHYGPRRSYVMAACDWHRRMQAQGELPLAQIPERRPFDIPPALALSDAPAAPHTGDWLRRSRLFDDRWYMQTYPDLRVHNVDGASHYLEHGAAEGRDPGPGFSTSGYGMARAIAAGATRDPDTADTSESSLAHYLREGAARGLDPLPVFAGALPPPAPARHLLFFGHQARTRIFGAERSLLDMLDRARAAGFTASVVVPQILSASYLAELKARSFQVHVLPYGWLFGGVAPHPDTVARLAGLIRQSGAIEVHQNTLVLDAPLRAARVAGVPCVVHARELPGEDPQLCLDLGLTADELRRHMLGLATRFVANSRAVARWLDVAPDRVTILPNTVDPALAELAFEPADPPRIALIGSLSAKKGVDDFLSVARAFTAAVAPHVQARFVLIGPASPELEALGPLPGNVTHAGYAPDARAALAQADIVLCLSHFAESFGRTVLEAMTAGRPVICYDRGTPPDLIGNSGAGRVVPADDPGAVVRALREMLDTPGLLRCMSDAARAAAAQTRHAADAVPDAALYNRTPPQG